MLKIKITALAITPILLFVYMPRPPIDKAHFLIYPVLAILLFGIVMALLGSKKLNYKIESIDSKLYTIIFFQSLSIISLLLSFLINSDEIRISAVAEIGRSILLVIILIYGYSIATIDYQKCQKGLLLGNYCIIIGQSIIAVTQMVNPDLLAPLYSIEKLYALGSFRISGSLANPNLFGWVVSFATISGYILANKKKNKLFFLLVGTLLVFLSSSRTIIILYPIMFILANINEFNWYRKITLFEFQKKIFKIIILALLLLILAFLILKIVPLYSPYFAVLVEKILSNGEVREINSLNLRLFHWERIYDTYFKDIQVLTWIFGIGSRSITRVVDNDFLYVFYRTGLIGLLIHLSIIFYSLIIFIKTSKHNVIGVLGTNYILSSLIFGMMFDHLGGWYPPLLLFFLLGLSVGILRVNNRAKFSYS